MAKSKKEKNEKLTEEELAEANGEPLPERQAMSVMRPVPVEPLPFPVVPDGDHMISIDPPPDE